MSWPGAGEPWAGFRMFAGPMKDMYDGFAGLPRISARFAVRLVGAGVLTSLERLGAKLREHLERAAGAGGSDAAQLQLQEAGQKGFDAFRCVPRVSRLGWGAGCAQHSSVFRMLGFGACTHALHVQQPGVRSHGAHVLSLLLT